jgi:predicted RNA-binding protein with PIN domain
MPYLIDGHNLIPKMGLRLNDPDDEQALIARLQAFCRQTRKSVEVYFDGAPPGQAGVRKFGAVTAHFVRQGSSADAAIRQRLHRMGKSAKNWVLVTSDRQVQAEGRAVQSQVISSEAFTRLVDDTQRTAPPGPQPPAGMSDAELADWLRLFGED